jgi:chromosome segregation ATPase
MLQIRSGLTAAKERKQHLLAQLDAEEEKIITLTSEVEKGEAAINEVGSRFSAELENVQQKERNFKEKRETLKRVLDKMEKELKSSHEHEQRLIDAYQSNMRLGDRVQQTLAAVKTLQDIVERLSECCIENMDYGFYTTMLHLEGPVIELEVALVDAYEDVKSADEAIGRYTENIQVSQAKIESLETESVAAQNEALFHMAEKCTVEVEKLKLSIAQWKGNITHESQVRNAYLANIEMIQSMLSASRLNFQAGRDKLIAKELSLMHQIRVKQEALKEEAASLRNEFSDDADYVVSIICSIIENRMDFLKAYEVELLELFSYEMEEEEESVIVAAPDISTNADNGLTLLLAAMACVQKDEFECSGPLPE